jgi:hypothetical protein
VPNPAEVDILEDERADGNGQASSFEKGFFVKSLDRRASHLTREALFYYFYSSEKEL